jgi:hypothetical protein
MTKLAPNNRQRERRVTNEKRGQTSISQELRN